MLLVPRSALSSFCAASPSHFLPKIDLASSRRRASGLFPSLLWCGTDTALKVTTPRAVRETLGPDVSHRTSRYIINWIEQDHRGIKQRYYPMRGFGSFDSAAQFCTAHDELRDHLRPRSRFNEAVSLAEQRSLFQERWGEVCALLQAA